MLAEAATQTKTAAAARGQARETPVEALLPPDEVLFGRTAAMQQVRGLAERMATTGLPALLSGESGTGKDVMARWLHEHSRAEGSAARFIRVNCPALPASLVESELFGHEVGAFTGAGQARAGWVEQAA
ncbi:MAG: sigma 54-interacting transcriptional regulator, partial [Terriglobales bacterium]